MFIGFCMAPWDKQDGDNPFYVLKEGRREAVNARLDAVRVQCPQPQDGFVLTTLHNSPSKDLCRFWQMAALQGVHLNVLGWEPKGSR